jgi:WD40 repeat protein
LIPGLEAKNYEVLRVARVGGEDVPGIDIENIYVFNLLRSLTQRDVPPEILAKLNLSEFLAGLQVLQNGDENEHFYDVAFPQTTEKRSRRRVLIIDQFEEIFSTHPEAWARREDFFEQVAQAMEKDSYLWVVLVMREDYIAALDPYAHLMPGGLRTRYYMQRLAREAAIQAVRRPVENLRPYEPGVAEKLVDDLSSIKIQKPEGILVQPGQYVEPVQLQVVCYGLWQNLPPQGTHITEKDLQEVGDVDEALGKYYDGRVAEVAHAKHVKERLIRDWLEDKLIAPGGIRSMVLQDTSRKSGEIHDDVIQALQSDLVRAENRGGTVWYELTHDRLVGPILASNKRWFEENLSPLQRQATLWHDQDKNESWLLRDQALAEVETWAVDNPDELTEREVEFLAACRKQQAQLELEQKERLQSARRMRTFLAVVTILAVIAGLTAVRAYSASVEANLARDSAEQAGTKSAYSLSTAEVAEADALDAASVANTAQAKAEASANSLLAVSLAAKADSLKNDNYPLALLLGVEAYERGPKNSQTWTTLFQLLQFTPYRQQSGFEGPVSSVAVSPDGTVIAVASRHKISLFDVASNRSREIPRTVGVVYSLAFHEYESGLVLAAGGCVAQGCSENRGQLSLWEIIDHQGARLIAQETAHRSLVKSLAFSPGGELLASGSYDRTILLWDMSDPEHPQRYIKPLIGHFSFVNSLAFSPDGETLISAGDDRNLFIWNVSRPARVLLPRNVSKAHSAPVNAIAFSPDETKLATASDDNSVILWEWDPKARTLQRGTQLKGHTGYVKSIAFHRIGDQTILASAGFDGKIILWDLNSAEQWGPPLEVHSSPINSIAFGTHSTDDRELPYLISGRSDRTMILWDLSIRSPLSTSSEYNAELSLRSAPSNGKYSASSAGQLVELKDESNQPFLRLSGFENPVSYVGFDGPVLLTVYQDSLNTPWLTRWTIDPEDWVSLACEAVGRNLTQEEWEQFLPNQDYHATCDL